MEVIVGVVFLQIGEPVQAPLVRLVKGEAQVLLQDRVHLRGRTFHKVHHGVLAAIVRLRHGLALLLRHLHGLSRAVVEEREEVDLPVILRGLHGQVEELVHHIETAAVEYFGIEPLQLLRRQGPVLRRLQGLGFGEGTGADQKG